ncbi:MAG: RDD family protein [Bacilli bacterium]|nr:RDD family protein [Bacilli bacterium]
MKKIYLAGKGKRILARFIDFIIMLAASVILYFTVVYPHSFNLEKYRGYASQMLSLYQESGLYVTNEKGQYSAKSDYTSSYNTIDKLYKVSLTIGETVIDNNNVSKDLYIYYTTGLNEKYGGQVTFNYDSYCSTILKVGSAESNIASFNEEDYTFTLIDEAKASTTISYFLSAFKDATITVNGSEIINNVSKASNDMVINSLLLIIPVVAGFSLVLDGLVPFFAPYGQTIGKFITHLIVLTSEGHRVNRFVHLFRWLIYFLELAFGVATFGGGILIPYTMFLFTKKRQALHDFIAHTVVADGERSIFYDTAKEEAYITNKLKEKGLDLDESSDSSGKGAEE